MVLPGSQQPGFPMGSLQINSLSTICCMLVRRSRVSFVVHHFCGINTALMDSVTLALSKLSRIPFTENAFLI